jgi:hypothetical protein
MTGLNRDTKVNRNQNRLNDQSTVNLEAFQKISAESRDLVGKKLVAGRLPANNRQIYTVPTFLHVL